MSTSVEPPKGPRRRATTVRAKLRGVPKRRTAKVGDIGFVMILIAVLVAGVGGLLALNTQIQDRAFTVNSLAYEASRTSDEQSKLQGEVADASSTSKLLDAASQLGMVPAGNHVGYLLLSNGTISGTPTPITGAQLPNAKTPAQQAADAKAKAEASASAAAKASASAASASAAAASASAQASASPSAGTPTASPAPSSSPSATQTGNR